MSRRILIDANVTLAWLFEEAESSHVEEVLTSNELLAPCLWKLEVINAVLVRERRRRVSTEQASRLLWLIDEMTVELIPEPVDRLASASGDLARQHQLSSYDAVYLECARDRGLPLFTRDGNLLAAARRVGVELVI